MEAWGIIQRVRKMLTEEERADLLGSFVQSIEITEKESVTLELLPKSHSLDFYSYGLALKSDLRADREVIANHFPLLLLDSPLLSPDHMRGFPHAKRLLNGEKK